MSRIHAHRSSLQRAKDPLPRSPSTPTSSRRTSAMPSIAERALPQPHLSLRSRSGDHDMTITTHQQAARTAPPSKHQLALMIWLCVFPTLTVINLAIGDRLRPLSPVLRT